MHELTIAKNIVDTVLDVVRCDPDFGIDSKVKSIQVEVGALSGVINASLVFCFPVVSRGTVLENTVLDIIDIPMVISCLDCGLKQQQSELLMCCNGCQSLRVKVISGKALTIKSIEVE